MNIDIRKSIINNFKQSSKQEIKESIIDSLKDKDDITLPGMGVFFELLWEQSDSNEQEIIINNISNKLKNYKF